MKTIVIRSITLLNFKGVRNLTAELDFETNVFGANGTGKTTVFDAFTWLLFGKDSRDRKDFNIKTLDANNQPIEKIPHEVSAVLEIDGEEITLKKCYSESWKRTRGSQEAKFSGHTLECFYNDVPCSVTEYSKKISEICDEQVFKLITSPTYFVNQKKDFQRNMLLQLAGGITDALVIDANPELTDVVACLSGKTIDELKREVQAKKRKIKEGIENIPARIDERKRDMPEELDWSILERDIASSEEKITAIQMQIKDRTQAYNKLNNERQEVLHKLSQTRADISKREADLKDNLLSEYYNKVRTHEKSVSDVSRLENERRFAAVSLPRLKTEIEELNRKRESLIEEWHSIKTETFVMNEEELCCPVCHRPLEAEDIESKRNQMLADFNNEISRRLEANKTRGIECKTAIEMKQKELAATEDTIFKYDEQIACLKASPTYNETPQEPYIQPFIEADEQLVKLRKEEQALSAVLESPMAAPDTDGLLEELKQEQDSIKANQIFLEDRKKIAESNRRIAELEKELSESQAEYAELEGLEFRIQEFSKAKMDMLEQRINGMFSVVRFKMFEQQINGGEVETCEAMVDGVPYSDLNNAMKCNAGIDIINAFCRSYGISAPIFIDNRESISELLPTKSQIINLIVDKNCKTLKIY